MGSESLETPGLPQWPLWSSLVLTVKMCQMSVRVLRRQKTRSSSQFRESRVLFFWCFPVKKSWPSWVCLFLWLYVSAVLWDLTSISLQGEVTGGNPHHWGPLVELHRDRSDLPGSPGDNLSLAGAQCLTLQDYLEDGMLQGVQRVHSSDLSLEAWSLPLHSVHRVLFHTRTELSGSTGKEVSSEVHYLKLGIRSHKSWKIIQIRL